LAGLGIEPLVGRRKPEAVLFFRRFLLDKQKKSTKNISQKCAPAEEMHRHCERSEAEGRKKAIE
jgi:hypothetical protein